MSGLTATAATLPGQTEVGPGHGPRRHTRTRHETVLRRASHRGAATWWCRTHCPKTKPPRRTCPHTHSVKNDREISGDENFLAAVMEKEDEAAQRGTLGLALNRTHCAVSLVRVFT